MNDPEFDTILTQAYAKKTTQDNYRYRLKIMQTKVFDNKPIYQIIAHPEESYATLRNSYPNISTRKNMLTVILALFKNSEKLQQLLAQQHKRWKTYHDHMDSFQEAKYKKHMPDAKQLAKYTPFEDIELKYNALKQAQDPHGTMQDSLQLVLLSVIVSTPPKRSDYGNMEIFHDNDPGKKDANYIVLRPQGESYMVFNKYKSKEARRVDQELPPSVVKDIRDSLRRHPRSYLFVNRFKNPYVTNDGYSKYVIRIFRRLFGKDTGVTMLRHIYITEKLSFDEMDDDKLEEVAQQMMHSTKLQRKYNWSKKSICNTLKKLCKECTNVRLNDR